jgi:hypothetical protein
MRFTRRALAATAATLALTAGTFAGSASATPEDGKGCVGLPSNHAVYVCVISITPTNALPTNTSTPLDIPVPEVCYFLECTDATKVTVPVPGVTEGSGQVATLWHNDHYYPIAVGSAGVLDLVVDAVDLALGTYQSAYDTVWREYGDAIDLANEEYDYVVSQVNDLNPGYTLYSYYRTVTRNTYVRTVFNLAGIDSCETWDQWLASTANYYCGYYYYA